MRRRLVLQRLAMLAFGVVLGGVLLEIAVRLFFPVSDRLWGWDPVLGHKPVPGVQGRYVKRGLFDVNVSMNSHGFRDRDHALEKPSGTQRVVLLGDSMIEAVQVRFEDSVPALLQARLDQAGARAEVLNLGVSAYGPAREYLMLETYGLRYRPDVVVLFFVGNDVRNNSKRIERNPFKPYPILDGHRKLARDDAGRPRSPLSPSHRDSASARSCWSTRRPIA